MRLNINKARGTWWTISAIIILIGMISMVISSLNPSIKAPLRPSLDFIGGTRLQLVRDCSKPGNCDQPIDINARKHSQPNSVSISKMLSVKRLALSTRKKIKMTPLVQL